LKVLTKAEVKQWFAAFPCGGEFARYDGSELFFAHPEANCIDVEYPPKVEQVPFLARYLATIGYEPVDFRGAAIWVTGWGVWNPLDESPGYRIVEAMCSAAGQPMSFEAGAGYQFRADELEQAIGLLLQPMIFGWDANYYPSWSYGQDQFFLHVSHDSFVTVVTRTKEFYDRVLAHLRELDLDAKPGHELRVRRFCRVP
jgi:hypothetical protein